MSGGRGLRARGGNLVESLVQLRRQIRLIGEQRCTLYSNVEPCAMCSYCIRETRIRKVVYAIRSPIMGGHSKWRILQDPQISSVIPEVFGGRRRSPAP